MALDAGRLRDLDTIVRRMGAIASVFDVRSSTLGNKSFAAFRDLMDVYIDLCSRELKLDNDFMDGPLNPTSDDVERVNVAFERIFGKRLDQFAANDPKP